MPLCTHTFTHTSFFEKKKKRSFNKVNSNPNDFTLFFNFGP